MPCPAKPPRPTATPAPPCWRRCAPTRPRTAILTDVDGTLAPIVERPEQAAVPARAARLLARLSERYGLVGCVSGRQARDARRLVGVDGIAYAGNHGLELLLPGTRRRSSTPRSTGRERDAAEFVAGARRRAAGRRSACGPEDKGPIQALHWRGADDERAAEARAREIAADGRAGRASSRTGAARCWSCARPAAAARTPRSAPCSPPTGQRARSTPATTAPTSTPSAACASCASEGELEAGDLRRRHLPRGAAGARRGVRPARRRAGGLARDPRVAGGLAMPYTDLLRITVFLTGGEATALGAITAIARQPRRRHDDADRRRGLVAGGARRSASTSAAPSAPPTASATPSPGPAPRTSLPARDPGPDRPRPALADRGHRGRRRRASASSSPAWPSIGAGYALLVSLAWRTHEARRARRSSTATASSSTSCPTRALQPVQLVRTPGLRSRPPARERRRDRRLTLAAAS